MGRALALTDQQLRLVQRAAQQVPLNHRPDFLTGVADDLMQLCSIKPITDTDVLAATQRYVERFADACCGGEP